MTKHEKDEILKGLITLAVAFDKEFPPDRAKVYLENLSDIPFHDLSVALKRAMRECKFFPSIAEIRELTGHAGNKQAVEDAAVMAWNALRSYRGRPYDERALDCPITRRCFEAMGGASLTLNGFGMWDMDQETWKRKEFMAMYSAYARDANRHRIPTRLEAANMLKQIGVEKP